MGQRNSGYERKERDLYETPAWVTEALIPHIPDRIKWVWEPSAGSGQMADVLREHYNVYQSDIFHTPNLNEATDYFQAKTPSDIDAIITKSAILLGTRFH